MGGVGGRRGGVWRVWQSEGCGGWGREGGVGRRPTCIYGGRSLRAAVTARVEGRVSGGVVGSGGWEWEGWGWEG